MSYSGTASFEFEIERYLDRESGNLVTFDKVPVDDDGFEFEYKLFTLHVDGTSYSMDGRSYGPPEDCYPDEGDTEIECVMGPDGKDWEDKLTDEEKRSIISLIEEKLEICEPDYDNEHDYYHED
jgi:hypothetical protein